MYKDYLTLLEEARQERRKAEQTAEAEQNAIMEIYNGSRFKFKRNAAPEEIEQAKQEELKHTANYDKACNDKKFYDLVIRITAEQLNYTLLNNIIETIKAGNVKGLDKPFHYKAFKKALESITPEDTRIYVDTYKGNLTAEFKTAPHGTEANEYLGYKVERFDEETVNKLKTYETIPADKVKAAAADVIGTRKEIEKLYEETKAKIDGLRANVNKFAGRAIYDYLPYAPTRMDNYNHY
jgi:hypothetical protein